MAVTRREPKPPMKTDSGWWANKEEVVVVPANTTEELQISCLATNSAGEMSETTRLEVTGEFSSLIGPAPSRLGSDWLASSLMP